MFAGGEHALGAGGRWGRPAHTVTAHLIRIEDLPSLPHVPCSSTQHATQPTRPIGLVALVAPDRATEPHSET